MMTSQNPMSQNLHQRSKPKLLMEILLERRSMKRKTSCLLSKNIVLCVILSNRFEQSIVELVNDVFQPTIITVTGLEIALENSTEENFTFIFGFSKSVC